MSAKTELKGFHQKKILRDLIGFFLILSLLFIICNGCATTSNDKIIYKDLPAGYVAIKKETLNKLLSELLWQKQLLLECLEREKVKVN